ncbi:hypothetical protein EB796_009167 [Bugula neritina]|uniref:Uncharacterized protein n=1 Tax=Bugula neritina TaxID=10212 RepID=A0A7J7K4Q6_BUGNE|nr:hypothetical protein EB796_009167 [Bugula neritina]
METTVHVDDTELQTIEAAIIQENQEIEVQASIATQTDKKIQAIPEPKLKPPKMKTKSLQIDFPENGKTIHSNSFFHRAREISDSNSIQENQKIAPVKRTQSQYSTSKSRRLNRENFGSTEEQPKNKYQDNLVRAKRSQKSRLKNFEKRSSVKVQHQIIKPKVVVKDKVLQGKSKIEPITTAKKEKVTERKEQKPNPKSEPARKCANQKTNKDSELKSVNKVDSSTSRKDLHRKSEKEKQVKANKKKSKLNAAIFSKKKLNPPSETKKEVENISQVNNEEVTEEKPKELAEGLGLASDAQESKEKDLTDESAEKDVKTSENMSLEDHELVAENLMDSKEMDLAKDIMKNEGLFTQHF